MSIRKKQSIIRFFLVSNVKTIRFVLVYAFGNELLSESVKGDDPQLAERVLLKSPRATSDDNSTDIVIKILISGKDRHIDKSDFLERRLESKELLMSGFTRSLQCVDGLPSALWELLDLSQFPFSTESITTLLLSDPFPWVVNPCHGDAGQYVAFVRAFVLGFFIWRAALETLLCNQRWRVRTVKIANMPNSRLQTSDSRLQTPDFRLQTADCRHQKSKIKKQKAKMKKQK